MGYLPIAVAIFGFVLLWAVVIYNSLLARRDQLRKMEEESNELVKQRHSIISGLQKFFTSHSAEGAALLQQLQQPPTATATQTRNFKNQLRLHLKNTTNQLDDQQVDVLLTQMEDTDSRLYFLHRKQQQNRVAYNNLVTRMPSRIIAIFSGFKPITEKHKP